MTPERWQRIKALYEEAAELPAAARSAWLTRLKAEDAALRREVEAMLAADQDSRFLNEPALMQAERVAESEHRAALIGQRLGHYQVLSAIGAGGMGEIYLARDLQLERQVALKVLPAEFTADADRVRRFAQEARAASALNHPNIITIHEIGVVESTHYIVTEYVVGETLRQRMMAAPQQRMTATAALDLAVQIAAALATAHEAGITHRDIKPENVMVRRDGIVKVLDFGLAKLTEPQTAEGKVSTVIGGSTESGVVMGTPRYMSPEQARGEKVDARTDLFSLGVLLYEMVAGCAPFVSATTNETIAAILRDEPQPLTRHVPAAPGELERIVSQTLRKERADRYQTAAALLADLKELKQELELQARLGETAFVVPPSGGASRPPSLQPQGGTTNVVTTNKDLIVLADFENQTGEAVFDGTLKQGLAMQLQQSPFLGLFPAERVRHTLRLMQRSPEERVTARIAQEICLRHDLKALIAGSIAALGSHYVITLEALNGQTGETLATEQVEAKSKEQVLRALAQAATRLRAKLGEALSSIQRFEKGLEETTTPKLEAFQAYALGYEQTLGGRLTDAIQLYRRAVELDPDFAYAWSMLSIHYAASGRHERAAEYAEKAYALKERVSDYEQLQIVFRYHFMATGDLDKALEAATLFKRTYPRTSTAPIDLLVVYNQLGRFGQAVAEGREALRLNPDFIPAYWYLGLSLLRVNRFAEVKELFQQALEQKFDLTNIHSILYQIACIEGDAAGMQQQIAWAQGKPEQYVALGWQAGAAACAGQWRGARELLRQAIDLAARGATKELAARYWIEQALWGAAFGDDAQAVADAAQGLALERGRALLPRAALALALCGESEQVEALMEALHQSYSDDTVINALWLPTISAALELQRGKAARALDHLQATLSYEAAAEFWPQSLRGQAYLQLGRGAEAAAEFQKIIEQRGHAPLSPLYPLAHLGLARAVTLTGDTAQRQQAYANFFAAWQEADADLPLLIEAQRECEKR